MGQVAEGVYGNFVQMVTAADGLLPRNAGCSGNQASMGCLRAASLQGMLPPRVENTFVQLLHFLSVSLFTGRVMHCPSPTRRL